MSHVIQPLTALQRVSAERQTEDNGFGLPQGEIDGWATFKGLAVPHRLWVARSDPHWLVGLEHAGVMADVMADTPASPVTRPDGGPVVEVEALGRMVRRMRRLAQSLPTAPLDAFIAATKVPPKTTEVERLHVERVGQEIFREALLAYWNGCCPLTGIAHPSLLRASHMKPWAKCETDAERLDVHNGLLLAAHLDAAFDAGLISFTDDGGLLVSPALSDADRRHLRLADLPRLAGLKPPHLPYLEFHRKEVFQG